VAGKDRDVSDAIPVEVRPVRDGDQAEWLRMRAALWPDGPAEEHAAEIAAFLGTGSYGDADPILAAAVFVAAQAAGGLCGFAEASVRPCAEGCRTWPVGYVEGWYVDPGARRRGIGGRLVAAAQQWALAQGCREMASDAHPANEVSLRAHQALGFEECGRAVHLRKPLTSRADDGHVVRPLVLTAVPGTYAVCRLDAGAAVPAWATAGLFLSISRTAEELSVVCPQDAVPADVRGERGWACLRVAGAIPFGVVGVLYRLTAPLSVAGVSVFVVSTFDTDYLLLKETDRARAVDVLRRQGHTVG
jgi:L-amino acid N-acyltransferase YncA